MMETPRIIIMGEPSIGMCVDAIRLIHERNGKAHIQYRLDGGISLVIEKEPDRPIIVKDAP